MNSSKIEVGDNNCQTKAIMMLGAPASGKGTQARVLAQRLGFFHLESGTVSKRKIESDSKDPEIQLARECYQKGELVPTKIYTKWLVELIEGKSKTYPGFVLDGSPRTVYESEQATAMFEKLYKPTEIFAFVLVISKDTAIDRALKRRICEKCQHPIPFSPETVGLIVCPVSGCGGRVVAKSLDKPEIIERRLEVFEVETLPAIIYLRSKGYLREIDGDQPISKVTEDIFKVLGL